MSAENIQSNGRRRGIIIMAAVTAAVASQWVINPSLIVESQTRVVGVGKTYKRLQPTSHGKLLQLL